MCSKSFFLFLLLIPACFYAQVGFKNNNKSAPINLKWEEPSKIKITEDENIEVLLFDGGQNRVEDSFLPRYSEQIALSSNLKKIVASIQNPVFENLTEAELLILKRQSFSTEIQVETSVYTKKKVHYGEISFVPIRKNGVTGKLEKLVSFSLLIQTLNEGKQNVQAVHTYSAHSVLQNGAWYKLAIGADGIYKLSYSFLQSMGVDVAGINPQNIRIYGNGGEALAELNSVSRADDLVENAIYVEGENDGVFDANDYVLFYGKGTNSWKYDNTGCPKYKHSINLYSDDAYYFLTVDLGAGKRLQTQTSASAVANKVVTSFDDYLFHENESTNLIKSGRLWFGEYFENVTSYNFSFSFPNIDVTSSAVVNTSLASRYLGGGSAAYQITSQSGSALLNVPSVVDNSYDNYAKIANTCYSFVPTNSLVTVNVSKQTTDAVAWLDYIEVNARRLLTMSGAQMIFRDVQSVGSGNVAEYGLTSSLPVQVWDISDITNAKSQVLTSGGGSIYKFTLPADTLKQFVAFTGSSFNTPTAAGAVANQDLHSLTAKDFIIVTHPDFYQQAMQLAAHHETRDTLSTAVVTPQQIYNEFSSGMQSASAIRDFVKMFYDRASNASELPKYLLLFGDGSYDNKQRFTNNTNYIPTYQSDNSTLPTSSYVTDDFYGLLDDGEGVWNGDAVDVGIGRFPVKTVAEAQTAVDKIISYTRVGMPADVDNSNCCASQTLTSPFGNWRNTLCFIADDEDNDIHISQADQEATLVDTTYKDYNIDKIYLDAFQEQTTPGGNRYPDVSDAINKRVEKGCLIINYTGHGGEVGLAHERIVEISQINTWSNINNLFLFFTATCEFSRYDNPEQTSAGEYIFLNPNGAAVALFSTVRLVFASPNFLLNRDFYDAVFEPINGRMPRLGDLYEYIKTQPGGNSVNSRNFTLLGDPALTLTYPKYDITTDSINSNLVTSSSSDTLKALSVVTIAGHVNDNNGNVLTGYNGFLFPTVFDKPQAITTLSNDGSASPPFTFQLQKNILYKGKVSVSNGYFKFSFVVPKDIAYQYGIGKISYYAQNGTEDAKGVYEKVIIGGSIDTAVSDALGPQVNLYLNDTKFVYGGLTNESPDIYSILKDENGINTVGNGIGHDITAVLDGNTDKAMVLNDYYQADLNSYKSGSIRYPLADISEGKHSLKLKVWDVYNNSSETYTEFVVAKTAKMALSHVLNYPNPFTTRTQFYFEHNQTCSMLEVQIQVYTISGKLVKTIDQFVRTEGFRAEPIEWNGRDDFGDKIGKGVYVYRVKVKDAEGGMAEKYEKLVILN